MLIHLNREMALRAWQAEKMIDIIELYSTGNFTAAQPRFVGDSRRDY